MFLGFFNLLRDARVPVTLREFLTFLEGLSLGIATYDVDQFYHFARAALVKDERHIDRFDRAFAAAFAGSQDIEVAQIIKAMDLPEAWLRKLAEREFTPEQMAEIKGKGGFDALMKSLKERLSEQNSRHQGGNKWIGTAGTSPFGAYGYNPEGVRIGQDRSRHQRAVKVWDKREFRDFDDGVILNTRAIKIALKRLRKWARDSSVEELDLDETIRSSAHQGYLDVQTRPERRNAVKVLLFLDVGGSMDAHVSLVEDLFSAARSEFRTLEHFYFHNCIYEGLWRDNTRRWKETVPTWDVLRHYGPDWKCIIVGDASMSPYEIMAKGGANEHWNEEPGRIWLERLRDQWPGHLWINPVERALWPQTQSVGLIQQIFGPDRMQPMTLDGLDAGMKTLT